MSYFQDLTPYAYDGRARLDSKVLNVGWLSSDKEFLRGPVPEFFTTRLLRLVESPINLYKGSHSCEFCPGPVFRKTERGRFTMERILGTGGNGEFHVPGLKGVTYVAPALIVHYVIVHQYLPPQEFVDAVLNLP
jgi:hypothetical protein